MVARIRSGELGLKLAIPAGWRDTERVSPKPSALDPAVTARIGDFLRARGLRRMSSRIQVLAVLEPVDGHLPVAEIHKRVRECLPSGGQVPDVATIYRTVTTLVDQDITWSALNSTFSPFASVKAKHT